MLPYPAQLEFGNALLCYSDVANDLMGVAKAAHFPESPGLGVIVETGLALWEKYKAPPTRGQLREALQGHLLESQAVTVLEDVLAAQLPDSSWAIEKGRRHIAEAEFIRLSGEMQALLKDGKHESVLARAKESLAIMSPRGLMTVGAGTEEGILARHASGGHRIPTRITELDNEYLKGGLERGRTGLILGKKGGGKSHCLVWLGAAGLLSGYRVVYVTLEMSEPETRARFDRALTGLDSLGIASKMSEVYPHLKTWHQNLRVVEASKRPMTIHGLKTVLDRIPKGEEPDILVLDYYQRLAPSSQGSGDDPSKSRISDLTATAKTLHEIAQEKQMAVWTAHQANRSGIDAMLNQDSVIDTVHASEAINALWDFDVILSINQTISESVAGHARIFVAENRDGPSRNIVTVSFRKDLSRIEGRM